MKAVTTSKIPAVVVRKMRNEDVPVAEKIFRLAFGSEFGLADPMSFRGDAGVVAFRHTIYPDGGVVAEVEGNVTGFSIASRWGLVGFVGPVCVHPEYWGRGIARQLVRDSIAQLDRWGCQATGLFTNPSSPRHLRLYQEFGFWPRGLTVVMSRTTTDTPHMVADITLRDQLEALDEYVARARRASDRVKPGLDLSIEIDGVVRQGKGDVLFLSTPDGDDFAICHFGTGSEGASDLFYVKYAQVTPGDNAAARFLRLMNACVSHASRLGFSKVTVGVNTRQNGAYRTLLDVGFRADMHGLLMHRPLIEILDAEDLYVASDWR